VCDIGGGKKIQGPVVKPRSQMRLSIPAVVQDPIERRVNINVNVIGKRKRARAHTLAVPGGRLLAENIADARAGTGGGRGRVDEGGVPSPAIELPFGLERIEMCTLGILSPSVYRSRA
jgi:hypothetical protein